MPPKYLRFEALEVFRPMPVPQQMRERIRQEIEEAKKLAKQAQSEQPKENQPCQ